MEKLKKPQLNKKSTNSSFRLNLDGGSDKPLRNQISMEDIFAELDEPKKAVVGVEDIISDERQASELKQKEEIVNEQKNTKKKMWNFIFLVINLVVVSVIVLSQLENNNVSALGELEINFKWLAIALLMFVVMMLTEQFRFQILIKSSTKKNRPFLSYKAAALGKYYEAITPFASGGQPFQVYYLKSRGINGATALSIPLAKYIMQQICFTIVVTFCLFTNLGVLSTFSGVDAQIVKAACWLGYTSNFIIMGTVVLFSINKKLGHKVVGGVLKFLAKIKIIKDYDKMFNKVTKLVSDYQNTMRFFIKSPLVMVASIVLSMLFLAAEYSIIFFVYKAFNGAGGAEMWFQILGVSVIIDLAAGFTPLPGGTGMSELAFTGLFSDIGGNEIVWAMLIWRLISYYGYVIQGILCVIYDSLIGNRKNDKILARQKKLEMQEKQNE